MKVYLQSKNKEGEDVLNKLILEWRPSKFDSYVASALKNKTEFKEVTQDPFELGKTSLIVEFTQPGFAYLPNNSKNRRYIKNAVYSMKTIKGFSEDTVKVMFDD